MHLDSSLAYPPIVPIEAPGAAGTARFLMERAQKGYFSVDVVKLLVSYSRGYDGPAEDIDVSREARSRLMDDHYIDWRIWKQAPSTILPAIAEDGLINPILKESEDV